MANSVYIRSLYQVECIEVCVGNCLVVKISLGKSLHTHKGFSFMCTDLEVCVGNGLLIKISLGKLYTHKGFSFRWTASIGKLHAHKVSLSGGLPWSLWRQLLFFKILLGKLHAYKKSLYQVDCHEVCIPWILHKSIGQSCEIYICFWRNGM